MTKDTSATNKQTLSSRKLAKSIADIASDKKAEDIAILDMRKVVNFCDYFVICTGNSDRQVKAIADAVEDGLKSLGIKITYKQGLTDCMWVIFDTGDVITHIFQKEKRQFYQLEYLWKEAKTVPWDA